MFAALMLMGQVQLAEIHQQISSTESAHLAAAARAKDAWYNCIDYVGKRQDSKPLTVAEDVFSLCIDKQLDYRRALIIYNQPSANPQAVFIADQDIEGCKKHMLKRLSRR